MNPVRKLYCRIYQKVFRALLPLLPYKEPHLLTSLSQVPQVLAAEHAQKPLIVTDANLNKLGLVKLLTQELSDAHIRYALFSDTQPNPTITNVEAARELYLKEGCDSLIAFGGGSPMDCAKACGARIACPHKSVLNMKGILKVRKRIPLLIAIPTTAGTGSETTLAAVITDEKTHRKYPINDFPLIPAYAVLDARVTEGLPPHVTAITGLDALVHATEAYIGKSTTQKTRAWAIEAVKLIKDNLLEAYHDGHNMQARAHMLKAAFLAGKAFSQSYVGYIHGIAHSLGGAYGIAHGLANAVVAPYVLTAYGKGATKKLARLARAAHVVPKGLTNAETAQRYIAWFTSLNKQMDIPRHLQEIKKEDILSMAEAADKESNPLYPVPRLMDKHELADLYYEVAGLN